VLNFTKSIRKKVYVSAFLAGSILALQGCSSVPSEVFTGSADCGYIGCATGGLQVYPHEEFSASVQPRRWYGWEWGQTSSAYHPNDPKHQELKRQECAKMRSYGLDCMGRPLR
jgi:hypothetical protein